MVCKVDRPVLKCNKLIPVAADLDLKKCCNISVFENKKGQCQYSEGARIGSESFQTESQKLVPHNVHCISHGHCKYPTWIHCVTLTYAYVAIQAVIEQC